MPALGILLTVCQQVMFAGETAMVHAMAGSLSLWQIAMLRSFGVLALACAMRSGLRLSSFKTDQLPVMILRALSATGYIFVFGYSFTVLPLTDASAISYSQTLYMTLFGDLILGEKATPLKWFIVLVGFAGAIVVAHPIGGSMTIVYLLIIAGTSLNALTIVLGRLLQRKDTAATTMFYPAFVNVLIFTPLTYQGDWHPSWLWTGILVLGPLGVCAGMYAVRYAEVAILAPWFYTRLIVAAFIGIVVMREIPDWWTIGGISMIVASCVMTVMFAGERRGSRLRIAE